MLGDGGAEGLNNASVCVEEVVPGHAGLPRHPSRDDDDVRPFQRLTELVIPHEPLGLQNSKHDTFSQIEPAKARREAQRGNFQHTRAGELM